MIMTNTEFMYAVVAQLWRAGVRSLDSSDPALHRAMRDAMEAIGKKALLTHGVRLYFDPITQTIGEVFHTASLLQSFKIARRPNPTYSQMALNLDEDACTELT